jgi:hypothetical protein
MLNTLLATAAHPMFVALASRDNAEAPYRTLLGLALIALVQIAAGLFMLRASGGSRR